MSEQNEKIPDPKELEKEISEFLAKKFGGQVKVLSPLVMTQEAVTGKPKNAARTRKRLISTSSPRN